MRRILLLTAVATIIAASPSPCAAQAQIFRVGPDGQYATVTAALTDLLAAPHVNNWIKVEAGVTTTENLHFPATWVEGNIWLSGGWDSSFLNQSGDPTDTVISGGLAARVIEVQMAGGILMVSDLSLVNGSSSYGSGILVETTNTCSVRLDNLSIHDNVAVGASSGNGAGVYAYIRHTNTLDITDCEIYSNASSSASSAMGGGIEIAAYGIAEFSIIDSTIRDNDLYSDNQAKGAGIHLTLDETATGIVAGCTIEGNTVSNVVPILTEGSGLMAVASGNSRLEIERNSILSNTVGVLANHEQVKIYGFDGSIVSISDSVVADGPWDGLQIRAADQATVYATNLTVADNDNDGILCHRYSSGTADVFLSNTISYANGDLNLNITSGPLTQTANLIGIDPEFVDPQALDFRVEVGSIAEDAGVPAPPGDLGAGDVRGGIRLLGASPDAGAHEGSISLIFSDGFDVNFTGRWSDVVGTLIQ